MNATKNRAESCAKSPGGTVLSIAAQQFSLCAQFSKSSSRPAVKTWPTMSSSPRLMSWPATLGAMGARLISLPTARPRQKQSPTSRARAKPMRILATSRRPQEFGRRCIGHSFVSPLRVSPGWSSVRPPTASCGSIPIGRFGLSFRGASKMSGFVNSLGGTQRIAAHPLSRRLVRSP